MGENYWKDAYQQTWQQSSSREKQMIQWIRRETGRTAVVCGLGAGSDAYIEGSAEKNGKEKGDADLHVLGTDVYIEVTGPLSFRVSPEAALWFRPDKIRNAIRHRGEHDTFLAHHCPAADLWRILRVDDAFIARYQQGAFLEVCPCIRQRKERYVEIPAGDSCVRDLEYLKACIREKDCCVEEMI